MIWFVPAYLLVCMHIQTHHIAKSFEGSPILSDVSFVIPKGERVGIVGGKWGQTPHLSRLKPFKQKLFRSTLDIKLWYANRIQLR